MADTCKHEQFHANVDVNRLLDSNRYIADVKIHCIQCQAPFHFQGITYFGLLMSVPSLSLDSLELHVPIGPGPVPIHEVGRWEIPAEIVRLREIIKLVKRHFEEQDKQFNDFNDAAALEERHRIQHEMLEALSEFE